MESRFKTYLMLFSKTLEVELDKARYSIAECTPEDTYDSEVLLDRIGQMYIVAQIHTIKGIAQLERTRLGGRTSDKDIQKAMIKMFRHELKQTFGKSQSIHRHVDNVVYLSKRQKKKSK